MKNFTGNNEPLLYVALICPDIPQNTGNIARLCQATGCALILVRPLGFRLTDAKLRRAGMDYWKKLSPIIFEDINAFLDWSSDKRTFFFSSHASVNYAQIAYKRRDILCFGSESEGLPKFIPENVENKYMMVKLPMIEGVRCLNVSACAAAGVYESLRQIQGWS